jgi:hypothetical protein
MFKRLETKPSADIWKKNDVEKVLADMWKKKGFEKFYDSAFTSTSVGFETSVMHSGALEIELQKLSY